MLLLRRRKRHDIGCATIYRDEQNCKTGMAARHKIGVFLQDECLQDRNGRVLSCGALWLQFWRDNAMTVSIEKLHEIIDLFAQFYTLVRVGYQTICVVDLMSVPRKIASSVLVNGSCCTS